jgi:hypothetical protein
MNLEDRGIGILIRQRKTGNRAFLKLEGFLGDKDLWNYMNHIQIVRDKSAEQLMEKYNKNFPIDVPFMLRDLPHERDMLSFIDATAEDKIV